MLRIKCPPLPPSLQAHLSQRQASGDAWNSLRTDKDKPIKKELAAAFHKKCAYCEQIEAGTVDHFWPQEHYPDRRWDWENFILACDGCQRKKLSQRPIDEAGHQMINPRQDEPLRYLTIDFKTGLLSALPTWPKDEARANLTLEILAFSKRPALKEERRGKLWDVLAYIYQVIKPETSAQDSQRAWKNLLDHLSPARPYLAVVRQLFLTQNQYTPLINKLRDLRPEIDHHIQTWCLPNNPEKT